MSHSLAPLCHICGDNVRMKFYSGNTYMADTACKCKFFSPGEKYIYSIMEDNYTQITKQESLVEPSKAVKPPKCKACGVNLHWDKKTESFDSCDCTAKKLIPQSADQVSIADSFENDLEAIISKYCGQGLTVGSAIGALQNRVFHLSLNIHMASIIEVVKRNLQ